MKAVFADTFYWIALTNPGDLYAQGASRFDDLLSGGDVYTTEEVPAEVLTFFAADSWLRSRAVETVCVRFFPMRPYILFRRAMNRFCPAAILKGGENVRVRFDDPDHSADERRFVTFGVSSSGRLLVVAYTRGRRRSNNHRSPRNAGREGTL